MRPGDILAGRFKIERLAAAGGMGQVFRGRDRASGKAVAIKALLDLRSKEDARFTREAIILSDLHHPSIVQYVTHGVASEGEPYLVMEWLEGEDLAGRLERGPLKVEEALTLISRAADALA